MSIRISSAIYSLLVTLITGALIPIAYFGDKDEGATKRLIIIAFIAALIFLVAVFW